VENAIDAGSTRIEVNITEGGIQRLSVIDNGCGMDAQDAQLCFGRHATSKIQSQNDLWSIHTLGFRGEALPSISSVSRMVLSTSDGKDATRVVVAYGNMESVTPYPCNQGTEISVEGLFYQTPARLKHMLKTRRCL
ncbi:DNA mismatch repair endonuclease MutL, partial [Mycobacterium tuberculosis]|uniref:DNA mismatch repair endonuclease MutL n=1 Tax=Mycobacterium tuberculosis TaxID=1773 RepID=UPI0019022AB5